MAGEHGGGNSVLSGMQFHFCASGVLFAREGGGLPYHGSSTHGCLCFHALLGGTVMASAALLRPMCRAADWART